ncbi:MAG: MgtC/SapB family protein [Protaetiibacter sp.]
MLLFDFFSDTLLSEIVLSFLAFALSACIGAERQRRLKSAGVRTHTLVGLGSAIFTLVSAYGFDHAVGPDANVDPSRIAAQVVSGIGFLGAGVIFVRQNAVNGLTTAASIWVTAAIGMACGAGMPMLAIVSTGLYFLAVTVLSYAARRIPRADQGETLVVRYREKRGVMRVIVETATRLGYKVALLQTRTFEAPNGRILIEANITFTHQRLVATDELISQLSETRGIVSVSAAGEDDR